LLVRDCLVKIHFAPPLERGAFLLRLKVAATLIAPVLRRSLAANVLGGRSLLGGQRSKRKSPWGRRAAKRLSEWTDFNSADTSTVVVFAPGLSRGNRPGDTERESDRGNQHLLPAHGNSLHLSFLDPGGAGSTGQPAILQRTIF